MATAGRETKGTGWGLTEDLYQQYPRTDYPGNEGEEECGHEQVQGGGIAKQECDGAGKQRYGGHVCRNDALHQPLPRMVGAKARISYLAHELATPGEDGDENILVSECRKRLPRNQHHRGHKENLEELQHRFRHSSRQSGNGENLGEVDRGRHEHQPGEGSGGSGLNGEERLPICGVCMGFQQDHTRRKQGGGVTELNREQIAGTLLARAAAEPVIFSGKPIAPAAGIIAPTVVWSGAGGAAADCPAAGGRA
jgi:hypothetical protein